MSRSTHAECPYMDAYMMGGNSSTPTCTWFTSARLASSASATAACPNLHASSSGVMPEVLMAVSTSAPLSSSMRIIRSLPISAATVSAVQPRAVARLGFARALSSMRTFNSDEKLRWDESLPSASISAVTPPGVWVASTVARSVIAELLGLVSESSDRVESMAESTAEATPMAAMASASSSTVPGPAARSSAVTGSGRAFPSADWTPAFRLQRVDRPASFHKSRTRASAESLAHSSGRSKLVSLAWCPVVMQSNARSPRLFFVKAAAAASFPAAFMSFRYTPSCPCCAAMWKTVLPSTSASKM
mmetsp:Transcript_28892/g.85990  ORF Transcript_28892/g.85990 Transcript_28892/m.85990 type:complete len:303 (-) Transcript_28892:3644-4552(-)